MITDCYMYSNVVSELNKYRRNMPPEIISVIKIVRKETNKSITSTAVIIRFFYYKYTGKHMYILTIITCLTST